MRLEWEDSPLSPLQTGGNRVTGTEEEGKKKAVEVKREKERKMREGNEKGRGRGRKRGRRGEHYRRRTPWLCQVTYCSGLMVSRYPQPPTRGSHRCP
jgi:hypothetical protein